jgi:hypothetical protein
MFCLDQKTTQKIYKNACKHFIENVSLQLQEHREVDEEVVSLVISIMKSTLQTNEKKKKEELKEKVNEKVNEVKNKTCEKGMKKTETQRRFKFEKQHFKGENDKFLRIGIEKTSRLVRRIKPDNWTEESKEAFYKKFPKLIDEVETSLSTSLSKKDVKKNKPDLISSLVQKAKKSNTFENDAPTLFQNISDKPKKKKKVSRKKKKETSRKIDIKEFRHEELDAYIDDDDNIWNDKHEKIGTFDRDENTIVT